MCVKGDKGAGGKVDKGKITKRETDYSQWYLDVLAASELAESSPVKGCMVIRPWGMGVWDLVRGPLEAKIKASGAQNAYFPVLIPLSNLEREAGHVEGFAKECAVVTHHRLVANESGKLVPDPTALLDEPLVVRPTSEAIIWHVVKGWIQSYRDLPLKLNQFANVVRWEMRTRPFLRTSEFLWQEGHTAHATEECAMQTTLEMIDAYEGLLRDVMAVPVVKGVKSRMERFAGADATYTVEALMQNGWALQAGTSHFLGQGFAKAFGVTFSNDREAKEHAWLTSWGVSTRLVGALIMAHSDDKGLVLPPRVAPVQVVLVPVGRGKGEEGDRLVDTLCAEVRGRLEEAGVRVKVDDREHVKPGPKFFEWERKGVPLRCEIGPKEAGARSVVLAARTGGDKRTVGFGDGGGFGRLVADELEGIQRGMLDAAQKRLEEGIREVRDYAEMRAALEEGKGGMFLAPWCEDDAEEALVQEDCKATIRCYPLKENDGGVTGLKCFKTGRDATHWALFARAF